MKKWLIGAVGALVVLVALRVAYVSHARSEASAAAPTEATIVSLADMLAEYDDNALEADGRYSGYWVRLAGFVQDIGRDNGGNAYVVLTVEPGRMIPIPGFKASFAGENEPGLASLRKGQLAYVACVMQAFSNLAQGGACVVTPDW